MSDPAASGVRSHARGWVVRRATGEDVAEIVVGVQELLLELGATPPPAIALEDAARELIDDSDAGVVLIAGIDGEVVGVLAASWQLAMHVPGRYGLIQDLWVHAAWRSRAIGADLVTALVELAHAQGVTFIEVGLPRESFAGIEATTQFYRDQGFETLGPRMRRVLA
ncbi:MAG TPA: GNAT family N-acetyltransferase [Solirubrobacteraceae bacterium]|nr:GNAT family N-acetyltransferase [Solirubrobacteraceae bacterium]